MGVGPDTIVPTCFEKSLWTVVTQLAILKAGGACVAIDPMHPTSRVEVILRDVEARVAVTSSSNARLLEKLIAKVVIASPSFFNELITKPRSALPNALSQPSDVAFVVFTSGSTGMPKGIVLEHRALCTSARDHGAAMRFTSKSRVLQFAAYTFDVSIGDIFTTLIHGGCVCIPSDRQRMDDLAQAIKSMSVNQIYLTPTVASLLDPEDLAHNLDTLSLGGEEVKKDNIVRWANKVHLVNIYGPAECSIWSTYKGGLTVEDDPRDLGRAIGCNTWIVDLNDHHKLAPIGCVGELLIEGPIVARGYLKNPEKTEAVFIKPPRWHPKSNGENAHRFYKCGDLARYKGDGTIRFAGRKDTQIKLRGQRIELEEIQHHFKKIVPSLTAAVADIIEVGETRKSILAAFLCLEDDQAVCMEGDDILDKSSVTGRRLKSLMNGLEEHLSQFLPPYMIPSAFIPIKRVPRTMSGKTDRKLLKKLGSSLSIEQLIAYRPTEDGSMVPMTQKEAVLRDLWAQVLGVHASAIRGADSFFALGGDSTDAMRLVARARDLSLNLSVANVLKHPTLTSMSATAEDYDPALSPGIKPFSLLSDVEHLDDVCTDAITQCRVSRDLLEDIYPCTPLQEGIVALSLKQPGSYVGQHVLRLPEALDVNRFKSAWEIAVNSSEVLRSRIIVSKCSNRTLQVVLKFSIRWLAATKLEDYIETDGRLVVRMGEPLSKYAIVNDNSCLHFVWTVSHALYDGWSLSLIFESVDRIYRGLEIPKPLSFNNFVSYLQNMDTAASVDYWQTQMRNANTTMFPTLPSTSYQPFADTSIIHEVKVCRKPAGTTTATIIRAAWSLLISHYLDTSDVIFGTTLAGRNAALPGLSTLVAPTMTTVPVRIFVERGQRVSDFMSQIQRQYTEMIPFEHTGLHNIRMINSDTRAACNFQSLLVIQPVQEDNRDKDALVLRGIADVIARAYPLLVEFNLTGDGFVSRATIDPSVIEARQTKRFLCQIGYLVQQLSSADPNDQLGDINLASPEDLAEIFHWNAKIPKVLEKCVQHLLEEQVRKTPDAPAVRTTSEVLSYSELDQRATKFAHYLQGLGVGPDILVPLCFEKSPWAVVANIAVLKAGGGCASVDPTHPLNRLEYIFEQLGASLLVVSRIFAPKFKDSGRRVIQLDDQFLNSIPNSFGNLFELVHPSNAAFVVFTSGSTGKPKGIIQDHAAYCTAVRAHGAAIGAGPDRRVLQFSAHTFDAFLSDVMSPLVHGGCVCIPTEDERVNNLAGVINQLEINQALLTPSVIRLLKPEDVPTLKVLILSGEALSEENLNIWADKLRLINLYGPSEVAVWCTYRDELRPETDPRNIGSAVEGTLIWLTDTQNPNRLAPVGAVGELVIEGTTLARGYLNNEKKTQESFIESPPWLPQRTGYADQPRRLYRTGDMGRYSVDGTITIIGRIDTQVKLRGQRVELTEIEYHIRRILLPHGIDDAAVEVVKPPGIEMRPVLVAFLSLNKDTNTSTLSIAERIKQITRDLEENMKQVLPSYMVPSIIIPVSKMPVTVHGKLDRKYLRKLVSDPTKEGLLIFPLKSNGDKPPPTTQREKELSSLWADVLGIDVSDVGADDNFMVIGGDSVHAMHLVAAAARNRIGLSMALIFQHPTLRSMSLASSGIKPKYDGDSFTNPFELVGGMETLRDEVAAYCNISPEVVEDVYPCTPLQEGLMAVSINQPGSFVSRQIYTLSDGLDLQKFKAAWLAAHRLSSIIRTRIVQTESSGFLQVVVEEEIKWVLAENLLRYIEDDAELPMPLGSPLVRFALVTDKHQIQTHLVLTAHHSIFDGETMLMLLKMVEHFYQGRSNAISPPAAFNQFIKYIKNTDDEASKSYWRAQLSDVAQPTFPITSSVTYQPQPTASASHRMQHLYKSMSSFTMPTIIRAAWGLLIARYSNTEDVVFGTTLNGRNVDLDGISKVLGPTITTVPVRIRICPEETLVEYLQRVQDHYVEMMPHEHMGLQNIRKLGDGANAACSFQNLIAIQPMDLNTSFAMYSSHVEDQSTTFFNYALNVECILVPNGLEIKVNYDPQAIVAKQIDRVLNQFSHVIGQLCAQRTEKIAGIEIISPEDILEIRSWNSSIPPKAESCLHQVIGEQMKLTPNTQAICSWEGSMTFKRLDELSSNLSFFLVESKNVKPGTITPLCFEKSMWTVVAMLAVMKAGASFIALDPAHPKYRLQKIIQDVGANFIVASKQQTDLCATLIDDVYTIDVTSIGSLPAKVDFNCTEVRPNDPAYVIFTSGSTGNPKGIVVEHSAYCSSIPEQSRALALRPGERVFQFASYAFDASILEILTTLATGGCVCIPSEDERMNGVSEAMARMGVTWAVLTPSVARSLSPKDTPALKTLVLAGEAMGRAHIEIWANEVKLINGFGPSECCVVSAANRVWSGSSPSNIGRAVGSASWITDPDDHNRLAPIGAIGELLLSGPTLARGYLNDKEKTDATFIGKPRWLKGDTLVCDRFYKSGDLVHYNSDGTMTLVGRKDTQVKLRGQRIELGEIEHQVLSNPDVQNGVVILPMKGPCKGRLVSIVTLHGVAEETSRDVDKDLTLIDQSQGTLTASKIARLSNYVAEILPSYMNPAIWLVLKYLPFQLSGKVDRVRLKTWAHNMSEEVYQRIAQGDAKVENDLVPKTRAEHLIRITCAHILNMETERINLGKSFLSHGGDSISAMRLMAQCKREGVSITVQDALSKRSLSQLALDAELHGPLVNTRLDYNIQQIGTLFELSPAQKMHFETCPQGDHTFNQGILLELRQTSSWSAISLALEKVIDQHPMLRARFRFLEGDRRWSQYITADIRASYRLHQYQLSSIYDTAPLIKAIQLSLDFQDGPMLAGALFNINGSQLCFITAHHLVVDLVSWRIILEDLEDLLTAGKQMMEEIVSFPSWCDLQAKHSLNYLDPKQQLPFDIGEPDYKYWGMEAKTNRGADAIEDTFAIDSELSRKLLGSCNEALRTDIVDILVTAILHSFSIAFSDRSVPAVFTEHHGRESWDKDIDLSRTVGWFTTICPIQVPVAETEVIEVLRHTKDLRRRIPCNGWSYYSSRYNTPTGAALFKHHSPIEIMLNYAGSYQQLDRSDGLFRAMPLAVTDSSDFTYGKQRYALFDIAAENVHNQIHVTFSWNKQMKHQDHIRRWVQTCKNTLQDVSTFLERMTAELTMGDFPLLATTSRDFRSLMEAIKTQHQIDPTQIEDILDASPMQLRIMTSQVLDARYYQAHSIWVISSNGGKRAMGIQAMKEAWLEVVRRHQILRTILVRKPGSRQYAQVVLKDITPQCVSLEADGDDALKKMQDIHTPVKYGLGEPHHRLTLCNLPRSELLCRLDISHALIDGASTATLLGTIAKAYRNTVPNSSSSQYRELIARIKESDVAAAKKYWTEYTAGITKCHFPTENRDVVRLQSLPISLASGSSELQTFCRRYDITISNLIRSVWALILRHYAKNEDVSFGYLTSGREIPTAALDEIVGPVFNLLPCRLRIEHGADVLSVLNSIQADYTKALPHQGYSLPQLEEDLKAQDRWATLPSECFNTLINFRKFFVASNHDGSDSSAEGIDFKFLSGCDPMDVSIALFR